MVRRLIWLLLLPARIVVMALLLPFVVMYLLVFWIVTGLDPIFYGNIDWWAEIGAWPL